MPSNDKGLLNEIYLKNLIEAARFGTRALDNGDKEGLDILSAPASREKAPLYAKHKVQKFAEQQSTMSNAAKILEALLGAGIEVEGGKRTPNMTFSNENQ